MAGCSLSVGETLHMWKKALVWLDLLFIIWRNKIITESVSDFYESKTKNYQYSYKNWRLRMKAWNILTPSLLPLKLPVGPGKYTIHVINWLWLIYKGGWEYDIGNWWIFEMSKLRTQNKFSADINIWKRLNKRDLLSLTLAAFLVNLYK